MGGTDSILEKHLEQSQSQDNTGRLSWVLTWRMSHELLLQSLRSFYLRIYFRLLSKGEATFLKCAVCVCVLYIDTEGWCPAPGREVPVLSLFFWD